MNGAGVLYNRPIIYSGNFIMYFIRTCRTETTTHNYMYIIIIIGHFIISPVAALST